VVLDNVGADAPVARLFPRSPGSLTVLTSRHQVGVPGAVTVRLREFHIDEGVDLLRRSLGEARVRAEPAEVAAVVEHCGGLPLAVGILAIRMQERPQWRFAELAARWSDPRRRFRDLVAGSRSVAAAFDSALDSLPPRHLHRLHRLASAPASELTGPGIVGTVAGSAREAGEFLDTLAARHLLTAAGGRYHLHRLLRDYLRVRPAEGSPGMEDDPIGR
jgi:hypothetical protein